MTDSLLGLGVTTCITDAKLIKLNNSENKLYINCTFRVLPTLVGMPNTLNSWPNAIEWERLILLALLDFSNEHEFSVSVLCRDSTELKLPEMFLWACLMDRKKRAEAWRIKPNFWLPFSASSSIHAPNKPEIEQMSDSIYSFCLVKSSMSNHAESNTLSTVYPTIKKLQITDRSAWKFVKLYLAALSRSQTNWMSFIYDLNHTFHLQDPQYCNFLLRNINCC